VKVAGRWSQEKLDTLRSALTLDDGYTIRPVQVEVVREWENNTRILKFILGEGRKRQIRKMCSIAHLVVLSLKRVAIGSFNLPPELQPGEWRDLTAEELSALADCR
jgi:16S rRNA pseudouridine516 synthase